MVRTFEVSIALLASLIGQIIGCGGRLISPPDGDAAATTDADVLDGGALDSEPEVPVTVVPDVWPIELALDDTYLYWTNSPSTVMKCEKLGCVDPVVLADEQDHPKFVVVDTGAIYWNTNTGVFRMNKATGSPVETVASAVQAAPTCIAIDAANVFWADTNGTIFGCPKGDCVAPVMLATGQLGARSLTSDGANIYWQVGQGSAGILRCPTSGCAGAPAPLVEGTSILSFYVGGADIYWAAIESSFPPLTNVKRCDKATCSAELQIGHLDSNDSVVLHADDTDLFWGDSIKQCIFGCPQSGGPVRVVASQVNDLGALAIDDASIFAIVGKSIVRFPK